MYCFVLLCIVSLVKNKDIMPPIKTYIFVSKYLGIEVRIESYGDEKQAREKLFNNCLDADLYTLIK